MKNINSHDLSSEALAKEEDAKARSKAVQGVMKEDQPTFSNLIDRIQAAHLELAAQAGRAVNISLTLRNWLIGYYIVEYELNGADRAEYGKQLLDRLAVELQSSLDRCYTGRYLRLCRQLSTTYPQIRKSLISKSIPLPIGKSVISTLPVNADQPSDNSRTITPIQDVFTKLSFTHIAGMDNQLFVSKYQLELPKKEDMQAFIDEQLKAEGQ